MIVTVHQPNFVPWFPYFQKMAAADRFILLTECQYEKGLYQNRFRLDDQWYTMPVHHGMVPICEKRYVDARQGWEHIAEALPQYADVLASLGLCVSESLSRMNTQIIHELRNLLGIKTEILSDYRTGLRGTARLVRLCQAAEADVYLAGPSGEKYLNMSLFENAGIEVRFQRAEEQDKRHTLEVLHAAA